MLRSQLRSFILVLALTCTAVYSQYDRDEVIQLTFPTTNAVIDTDSVAVAFDLAPYFTLGEPNCAACDGYITVYLNQELQGIISSGNSYVISNLIDGEYLLELEAVNPSGASFDPVVHDTVSFFVDIPSLADICPPGDLSIFAGNQENILTWSEPNPGFSGNVGCGDILITSLPFSDIGSTVGMGNDWTEMTGFSNAEDVAYTLNVSQEITINVDLCSPNTDFDSYLEIFTADDNCIATSTTYYYYDGPGGSCPESPAPYTPSFIENAYLTPGQYYIIVDGFSTNSGNYEITVTEVITREMTGNSFKDELQQEMEKMLTLGYSQADINAMVVAVRESHSNTTSSREIDPDCGDFLGYRIYDANMDTVIVLVDTTFYIHSGLTNDTEYCYYVSALYSQGESDTTNTVCGTPAPFSPDPPTNVATVPLDESVLVVWTAPDVPQLGIPYSEDFSSALVDMWSWEGDNWSIYTTLGNPAPSARFSWSPSQDDYEYSLYSPIIPLSSNTDIEFSYDLYLTDFGSTGTEYLAVEYLSGAGWVTIDEYSNVGDIPWATNTASLTGLAGSIQIRFRAYGADSFDIDYWHVDNVSLEAPANREITNSSISAVSGYAPNVTMDLVFMVNYSSSDLEYLDGASLTFPAGFTVNSASNIGGLIYNGETGTAATITFGELFESLEFSVNVTTGDISGAQSIDWALSGDTDGNEPHDVSGILTIAEQTWMPYEFMGYNVYVDSVLVTSYPIPNLEYRVTSLTNLVTYEFGVTTAHYPDYVSELITVEANPVFLFGDITGVISDPNGDLLDSAIVTAGGVSDTTAANGEYFLWDLPPGDHLVKVVRSGFDRSEEEVTVIAQEASVTQDFTLIPALARAHGLQAEGGDHTVYLSWRMPGGETDYDLAYYDEFFEAQIGCGGGCEFGVRFTPVGYPAALQSLLISVQGDASVFDASIIAYLDPDGNGLGPVGDPIFIASGLDLTTVNLELTQYQIDLSAADIAVNSGDIYVLIQENNSEFLGIANDVEPQSPEFYDRNWVGIDGEYMTVFDAVGGDPALTGDFGIMATFFGAAGRAAAMNTSQAGVQIPESYTPDRRNEFSATANPSITTTLINNNSNPANVVRLNNVIIPNRPLDVSREDSLVGFTIYQALASGDTLVTNNDGDTTAVISVLENYAEYCYNVKVLWQTESYGVIESKKSADACAVTFTPGDANFDSAVDISDLMAVVDYVLGVTIPTADQLRNTDINHDHEINIADIVMIVDIIFGPGPARREMTEIVGAAIVELKSDAASELKLNLAYEGLIRGMQFKVKYNPSQVELGVPYLNTIYDEVLITSNFDEPGVLSVVILNVEEGRINERADLITLSYKLVSRNNSDVKVALDKVLVAGTNGHMIPVLKETGQVDIQAIPEQYALHQNFPNPFNPVTEIQFDLPELSEVEITIYNLMGQKVRTLIHETRKPGFHQVIWNGLNDTGISVATGMYFYSLETPAYQMTKKMVLLK